MRPLSLILSLSLLSSFAHAWDPDDETFDPAVFETIIDGSSRIGDPSPVYPKGSQVRGFTYVMGSKTPEAGITVMVSLILTPDPAKPQAFAPGSAYLSDAEARNLATWLRKGAALEKTELINETPGLGKWTIRHVKEHGVILTNEQGNGSGDFVLSIPAAKKLAGAVEHALAKAEAMP
jgi:hypothetical protein